MHAALLPQLAAPISKQIAGAVIAIMNPATTTHGAVWIAHAIIHKDTAAMFLSATKYNVAAMFPSTTVKHAHVIAHNTTAHKSAEM